METYAFRRRARGARAIFSASVLFLALLFIRPVTPSHGGVYSSHNCDPAVDICNGSGKQGEGLTRTFTPRHVRAMGSGTQGSFVLTRDDFVRFFPVGHEVHMRLSPEDGVYPMDVGFSFSTTPKAWQMPAIPWEGPAIWTVTEPAGTPHVSLFPGATHALVSTNDLLSEGTVYLYYNLAETALILLGEAVAPPDGAPLQVYSYNFPITVFPMDSQLHHQVEEQIEVEGLQLLVTQDVAYHGFGTFQLSDDELLEAGAFYDDIVYRDANETDPDVMLGWTTYYTIIGTEGTVFSFYIADPPGGGDEVPIEGEVFIQSVELWRVVEPTLTAVADQPSSEAEAWTVYPNPATDVLRFSEAADVYVYDLLGRRVLGGDAVERLDVRALSPGVYVVRTGTSVSRLVMIQ